jgi:hypothetical protein
MVFALRSKQCIAGVVGLGPTICLSVQLTGDSCRLPSLRMPDSPIRLPNSGAPVPQNFWKRNPFACVAFALAFAGGQDACSV